MSASVIIYTHTHKHARNEYSDWNTKTVAGWLANCLTGRQADTHTHAHFDRPLHTTTTTLDTTCIPSNNQNRTGQTQQKHRRNTFSKYTKHDCQHSVENYWRGSSATHTKFKTIFWCSRKGFKKKETADYYIYKT